MSPGAADLLRLAAAGLPDFTELAQMLATRTQKSAREELFEALLPADVQIALRSDALVKGAYADPGALLHARFPGRELVGLAARAFAVLDRSWDRSDKRTEMLVEAVKKLAPADKLAGLEAIRGDQVALAGAAELFYRGAFKDLKPEQRHGWGPAVVEAALIQQANVDRCSLVQAVTTAGAKSVPLLLRVRRDEIAFPRRTQPNFWRLDRDPSPAACAMLALLEADKAKAAEELRAWRPSGPLDTAVARVARARLGDGDVADPALFKLESIVVAVAALDAYRARPSAGAIDVIVQEGVGHQFGPVRDKAAKVFAALTGVVLEAPAADDRAKAAQTWWQEHRAAWRPPAGAAR
jgi:hypothetical protein